VHQSAGTEPGDPVAEIAFRDAAADVFVVRVKRLRPPFWLRSSGWVVTALILMFNTALLWSMI
jgi:hypothetical protein